MDVVKGRILSIPDWNAWQKGVAIFNLCQLTADNAGSSADLPDDISRRLCRDHWNRVSSDAMHTVTGVVPVERA